MTSALVAAAVSVVVAGTAACDVIQALVRVPIVDVGAEFTIADATWFEEEQTLFFFYRVDAREGLSRDSVVEITYRTDDLDQGYVPLTTVEAVHTHLPAVCGPRTLCGSYSIKVERLPRDVGIQLRYHRDGALTLVADLEMHVVLAGNTTDSRSALVYGVFDRTNTHVQWRLRNQFPAIRNEQATALGLLRAFSIDDAGYGSLPTGRELFLENPYGYDSIGICPASFTPHETVPLATSARAIFDFTELSVDSYDSPLMCSMATVKDAIGDFITNAFAQKNPETRAAFPALQTPVTENEVVPFMFEVCNEPNSNEHREMQMQRMLLNESDVVCIDDWNTPDFSARLATRISARVDAVRRRGNDMVLVIALSRPDDQAIANRIEEALGLVVPLELEQSTPRLSGAFVYDSNTYSIRSPAVSRVVLWCPASGGGPDLDAIPDISARTCAFQPTTRLAFGEVSLSSLPILPSEPQFEEFIDEYGVAQTGSVTSRSIRAPTRTPTSDNVPLGDFGVATFFNNEAISAAPTDGFSYCAAADSGTVVFRIAGFPDVIPLSQIGELHAAFPQLRYELGLFWEFPFLTRINYESRLAAAVNLPDEIEFVAAFGIATPAEIFLGTQQWLQDEFRIENALEQCTRFCDHPPFDSSGVYNVDDSFLGYANRCYRPQFPAVGDDGFPSDP